MCSRGLTRDVELMSFNDAGPTVNLKTTSVQRLILAGIPPFTMFTTTPFNVLIIINFILLVTIISY